MIKITGISGHLDIDGALRHLSSRKASALQAAIEELKEESVQQCPKDTGELAASVQTEVSEEDATISYNTEYAVIQHERMDYDHPHGGKAKYLEDPMNDGSVQDRIRSAISETIQF